MRCLLFLFIFLTAGCVIPIIPSSHKQPYYEYLDEVAVVHVYGLGSSGDKIDGFEILVDGKMGREVENGEISVRVQPGNHTVALGTYSGGGAGYFIFVIEHIKVTNTVEKYFYPGETYYIRYMRSPKWSWLGGFSPHLQLTNKQLYDVEFALFRGLITYDAAQKAYVEENCNLDTAKFQNSKITTQSNSCGSVPSFDLYVQVLEEVHSNSFELDVWDMAFDEVRGDQNKQLAKYIELRADQLYAENAGEISATSLYKQAIPKTGSGGLSGTYHSSTTSNKNNKDPAVVFLTQSDNKVTGIFYPDKGDRISGTIDGNSIKFVWTRPEAGYDRKGSWNISSGGTKLVGYWHTDSKASDHNAFDEVSILTKIGKVGSASDTSLYQQATLIDTSTQINLSGTYVSTITGNTQALYIKESDPKVTLVQDGSSIIGTFGIRGGKIWGDLKDNTIKFDWLSSDGNSGKGKWIIDLESNVIVGTWHSLWKGEGKWNLTRVE
jgi:hypothetical protein